MKSGFRADMMIGDKGINDNILTELDRALEHHELIKYRRSKEAKIMIR